MLLRKVFKSSENFLRVEKFLSTHVEFARRFKRSLNMNFFELNFDAILEIDWILNSSSLASITVEYSNLNSCTMLHPLFYQTSFRRILCINSLLSAIALRTLKFRDDIQFQINLLRKLEAFAFNWRFVETPICFCLESFFSFINFKAVIRFMTKPWIYCKNRFPAFSYE